VPNPPVTALDQIRDPDEFVQAAMQWHFSPETGSPYWLKRAGSLDFDPRQDVKSFADLTLFPNVANELRDVPVRDLIPQGYGPHPPVVGVYESGGTTGAPKRVVLLQDWLDQVLIWKAACLDAYNTPRDGDWLLTTPSGPHGIGDMIGRMVASRGGIKFSIDMDPRWVKKILAAGKIDEAAAYLEHLIEQTAFILRSQDISVLVTTPPMLVRLARHDELAELIRQKVKTILWGGTHLDADTRDLLRGEVFPDTPLYGVYGNTMILAAGMERPVLPDDGLCVFDSPAPWITFSVINPDTGQSVRYGERGQVVMNHISKSYLLPNNLERDLAIRVEAPEGSVGDSVANVDPGATFDNSETIEGVY
jgi:phenylacetate-coenzyme A ligase PaaK-like adenylate-forming protein